MEQILNKIAPEAIILPPVYQEAEECCSEEPLCHSSEEHHLLLVHMSYANSTCALKTFGFGHDSLQYNWSHWHCLRHRCHQEWQDFLQRWKVHYNESNEEKDPIQIWRRNNHHKILHEWNIFQPLCYWQEILRPNWKNKETTRLSRVEYNTHTWLFQRIRGLKKLYI